ncbi:MAG: AAA family ATPase, partial [Caldilineaceae bacterium]|nr:AAA family ATPase [Caldilineaceae bacterium]
PIAQSIATSSKLVGREREWQQLLGAWQHTREGHPHLLLIQGEAGIGKTHLAEALVKWARQHNQLAIHIRAYAAEGQLSYSLVIEWLRTAPYATLATDLTEPWLTECSRLLPELLTARPDVTAPPPLRDSWQRRRLFEALARAALTPQQPLLVLLDDLQWADQETLEWLHFLLRFDPAAPLLLVGTVRMGEVATAHPLTDLQQQLHHDGRIQTIQLTPLEAAAGAELAQQTAGIPLPPETLAHVHRYAEGVPLFLIEVVRAEIEKVESERWRWSMHPSTGAPNTVPLPPKVYAVIQARLNQLSPDARQIVNLVAVIGRAFSFELLALVSDQDEERLVQHLDELWQRRILLDQGNEYDFSHDRIRDVAYAEIPPVQRKRLHRQVAEALMRHHTATQEIDSAQLAYHYEAAIRYAQAVEHYLRAGEAAQRVFAHARAEILFNRGIALLEYLPATAQRDQQALSLYGALAASLRILKGYTADEMYETVRKARKLSDKVDDTDQQFRLIKFLQPYHIVAGDLDRASALANQAMAIAGHTHASSHYMVAYIYRAFIYASRGSLQQGQEYFQSGLKHYDHRQHESYIAVDGTDTGLIAYGWSAHLLWLLGKPDQALVQARAGVALAQAVNHPFSEALTLAYLSTLHQFRQDYTQIGPIAEACLAVTQQHNIGYYQQWAKILLAWVHATRQPTLSGIAAVEQALAEFQAAAAGLRLPYYLALLAKLQEDVGQIAHGMATVDQAFAAAARYHEDWWNAELFRLRGQFLERQGVAHGQIETTYQQAIDLAHEQAALALELRATVSLARLWQRQGRIAEAHERLSAVYARFTEGFDTPDLQEARALLADLA